MKQKVEVRRKQEDIKLGRGEPASCQKSSWLWPWSFINIHYTRECFVSVSSVMLKSRGWGSQLCRHGVVRKWHTGKWESERQGASLRMQGPLGFPKTVAFPKWQLRGVKWNLPFMSPLYIIYASSLIYTGSPYMSLYFTLASLIGYMGTLVGRYEGYVITCVSPLINISSESEHLIPLRCLRKG